MAASVSGTTPNTSTPTPRPWTQLGNLTPILHDPPTGLLATIANTPSQPLAVGRAIRLATTAQRRALTTRDGPSCLIPGCDITNGLQPHHVTSWALDGATDLSNLVNLCHVHHRQTEHGHYRIQPAQPHTPPPGTHTTEHWWITPRHRIRR